MITWDRSSFMIIIYCTNFLASICDNCWPVSRVSSIDQETPIQDETHAPSVWGTCYSNCFPNLIGGIGIGPRNYNTWCFAWLGDISSRYVHFLLNMNTKMMRGVRGRALPGSSHVDITNSVGHHSSCLPISTSSCVTFSWWCGLVRFNNFAFEQRRITRNRWIFGSRPFNYDVIEKGITSSKNVMFKMG